jgi:hypothetical protein
MGNGEPQGEELGRLSAEEDQFEGFLNKPGRATSMGSSTTTDSVFPLLGGGTLGIFGALFAIRRRGSRAGGASAGTGIQIDISDAADPDIGEEETSLKVYRQGQAGQHKCGHSSNVGGNCLECDRLRSFS